MIETSLSVSPRFNFQTQLTVGNSGECNFLRDYRCLKPKKSPDLKYDFALPNRFKIELKTDTYSMEKSENFFLEHHVEQWESGKQKIGGPWRSVQDGVELFIYYFLQHGIYFWFDAKTLVKRADSYIKEHSLRPVPVNNNGYSAYGYKIPRSVFDDVLLAKDVISN